MQMSSSDQFCQPMHGGGMIMYMDGLHWTMRGNHACLNLYFSEWTLDSRSKFLVGMLGVLVLGIVTEGVSRCRHNLVNYIRNNKEHVPILLRLVVTSLHGLQALVGYIVMLAAMTFSMELLLSVIAGLTIGYALFWRDDLGHVTTNPCCSFMQEEADEQQERLQTRTTTTLDSLSSYQHPQEHDEEQQQQRPGPPPQEQEESPPDAVL